MPKHDLEADQSHGREEKLILGVVRFLADYVRKNLGLARPELSLLDRVQAANIYALKRTDKYNDNIASFTTFVGSNLDKWTRRQEEIGAIGLFSGGLIRIRDHKLRFHQIAYAKRGIEFKIGQSLEAEDMRQFLDNPKEEFDFFTEHNYQFDRLEDHPELEAVVDEGRLTDPEAAVLGRYGGIIYAVGLISLREKIILADRLGLDGAKPKTRKEIAQEQIPPVTGERIRQIENKILEKLFQFPNIVDIIKGEREL